MAYYLTIKRNNEYKKLDLSSLEEFERKSCFKNFAYSLEEIDCCTSSFDDEISFKEKLYEKGIIEFDDITRELSIRKTSKGDLYKVMYGIVYSGDSKYLDYDYLKMKILSLQNDKEFLKKLVSNYRNSYINNVAIAHIRNCLYSNYNEGLYESLCEFVFREIYSKPSNETGELKLKYKSLHDLGMFVCNYEYNRKLEERVTNSKIENNLRKKRLLELQKSILSSLEDKKENKSCKKRILKKKQIEGQISLFDEID